MSNINPIATTKIASGTGVTNAQALSGSGTGVFSNIAGMNFIDLIIARLTADDSNKTQATGKSEQSLAENTKELASLKKDNPLALLQIALASQTTDENGNVVLAGTQDSAKKLETQLGLTNTIINHLKNVMPENAGSEKNGVFEKLLARLQTKSDTLQASLSALEQGIITKDTPVEDIPQPILILFGLNPSQISEVTDKVQKLEEKLGRDITVEDMIAGVGGILPPPETSTLTALTVTPPKLSADAIDENTEPTDDLAAQLNALDVGGSKDGKPSDEKLGAGHLEEKEADTNNKKLENSQSLPQAHNSDKKASVLSKEAFASMLTKDTGAQGQLVIPAHLTGAELESALSQQYGVTPTSALPFGSTAQSANIIATSATAGQPHPAVNTVAAHISKFANNTSGINTNQTLLVRLDPPELGNLRIRLKFGADNSIKAHLTAEKPETYMMLQRDAQSLERTLQQSGFDTSSISFELAHQGNNSFGNNGEGGGEKNFGSNGNAGGQDALLGDEIIQSSVTWQVDPSTGHVRYNIFA